MTILSKKAFKLKDIDGLMVQFKFLKKALEKSFNLVQTERLSLPELKK